MIIQIDRYDPQVIEFAEAYLDYYRDEIQPDHRLATIEFRDELNKGDKDSKLLGIGFDYDLSRFNKEAYDQSKKDGRRRYDFPRFDGELILIFQRYLVKCYEKKKITEAIKGKIYSELGMKPPKKSTTTSKIGGRKSRRRVCCIHRTRRTRRRSKTTRKN